MPPLEKPYRIEMWKNAFGKWLWRAMDPQGKVIVRSTKTYARFHHCNRARIKFFNAISGVQGDFEIDVKES